MYGEPQATKFSFLAIIGLIFAIFLVLFGFLNLYSLASPNATNTVGRVMVALICFAIGGGIIFAVVKRAFAKPEKMEVIQKIDLTGDVAAKELTCQSCGAILDDKSVSVQAGAVFISCSYCHSSYQLTEDPKW